MRYISSMKRLVAATVFLASCGLAPAAQAVVLTLPADRDNSLFQEDGDLSNGAGPRGFVGRTVGGLRRRMLVRFDVSAIPPDAEITRVELALNMSRTIADDVPVGVHRVLADWGESGSDSGFQGGTGATAQTGDATWTQRFWPATPWATPGGDFAATASAMQTVGQLGSYTFGSTPGLVADVGAWVAGATPNFGWILVADETVLPPSTKRFDTREVPEPQFRPALLVEYEPAPVTIASSIPATDPRALAALAVLALGIGLAVLRRAG
jgi:hypothetical protein